MLGPGRLVEGESDAGVVEGLADEVATLRRDVGVFFAEDLRGTFRSVGFLGFFGRGKFERTGSCRAIVATHHDELAGNVLDTVEAVVILTVAESVRVDIGGEVADCGLDAFVEGGAESEVAAETHAGGTLWKYVSYVVRAEECDTSRHTARTS